ncbi:MAG: RluA family pseudouridine synthase [Deltaproteobacteria bacterium]|nr:RluA family pseudouridine synthase [Deltaproteobacteria bacterium]
MPREARGRTVEAFLRRHLPGGATPGRVDALLRAGAVTANGKPVRAERKLWGGEELVVAGSTLSPARKVEGPSLAVLAESQGVVIVDKPAGWSVEPEPGQVSVVELLAWQRPGFDVGGTSLPGVAHRLDRNTTGALAFARTDAGLAVLQRAFGEGSVEKRYLAVVLGTPPESGRFDTPYARDPSHARRYTTRVESPRRATLSWRLLEQLPGAAALEVTLETGRTHQIRCQFAEAGLPVLGDSLYGGDSACQPEAVRAFGRQALHAHRLALTLEDGCVEAEAKVPADLQRMIVQLKGSP